MEHQFYTDRLSAYFDKELKNEEHAIVDEHVKQCEECQNILAQLEKLDAVIDEKSGLAGDMYWEKSAQKIESALGGSTETQVIEVNEPKYRGLWWKMAGAAASVAFLAFITLYEGDITDTIDPKLTPPSQIEERKKKEITPETAVDEELEVPTKYKGVTGEIQKTPETAEEPAGQDRTEKKSDLTEIEDGRSVSTQAEQIKPAPPVKLRTNMKKQTASEGTTIFETDDAVKSFAPTTEPEDISGKLMQQVSAGSSPKADRVQEIYSLKNVFEKGPAQQAELDKWRNTVMVQNTMIKGGQMVHSLAPTVTKRDKSVDSVLTLEERNRQMYNQLFEAYYNVALITNDRDEKEDALSNLHRFAQDAKSPYQLDAQMFLNQYDSIRQILDTLNIKK